MDYATSDGTATASVAPVPAARRAKVVEVFPDIPSVIRLVGALITEADDERQTRRRYFSKNSMRQVYEPDLSDLTEPEPLRLAPVH